MTQDSLLGALPPELPGDLRAFLECRTDVATLANGPVTWVQIPAGARGVVGAGAPVLTVVPGSAPGSATVRVSLGWVKAALPAAVVDGRLVVDTGKLPFLTPGGVRQAIQQFVEELNGRLAANGKQLAEPTFGPEGVTLNKVQIGG